MPAGSTTLDTMPYYAVPYNAAAGGWQPPPGAQIFVPSMHPGGARHAARDGAQQPQQQQYYSWAGVVPASAWAGMRGGSGAGASSAPLPRRRSLQQPVSPGCGRPGTAMSLSHEVAERPHRPLAQRSATTSGRLGEATRPLEAQDETCLAEPADGGAEVGLSDADMLGGGSPMGLDVEVAAATEDTAAGGCQPPAGEHALPALDGEDPLSAFEMLTGALLSLSCSGLPACPR